MVDSRNRIVAICLLMLSSMVSAQTLATEVVNMAAMRGWDIVIAKDAVASERYAAEELQRFFEQASGIKLPMVATTKQAGHHVFIGPGESMPASNLHLDTKAMGNEDFRIVIRDGNIAIVGGRPRGTLYGVYTFLEDYVGVRFLTKDHTHVPRIGASRIVGPVDRSYHPPLEFRWSFYSETNENPAFAARLRVNTVAEAPELGGKTGIALINHSFLRHCPAYEYGPGAAEQRPGQGKKHPEYFAVRNGQRNLKPGGGGPQLCLTNPDVLKIVTASVLRDLKLNPSGKNISVSQNDNSQYCQCADCAAIDEREGTPMGSLLTFVNAVADEVAKEHPDVMVGTLAYQYSRKPPKTINPRPNVQIQLSSIECCMIHPIDDPNCPANVGFCGDLADWGKICSNIYIWDYNTNFSDYTMLCPNLRVIEPNIRYFLANRAKGVFMQAVYTTLSGELSDLRNYVTANILWDPSRSGRELTREFLDLHYGQAAEPIRRFIERVHDKAEASGVHRLCFAGRITDYGLDESTAKVGLEAFDEAMKLAESHALRSRVEKASISAYRAAIDPVWRTEASKVSPAMANRMRPLVRKFLKLCEKHELTRESEGSSIENARDRTSRAVGL